MVVVAIEQDGRSSMHHVTRLDQVITSIIIRDGSRPANFLRKMQRAPDAASAHVCHPHSSADGDQCLMKLNRRR